MDSRLPLRTPSSEEETPGRGDDLCAAGSLHAGIAVPRTDPGDAADVRCDAAAGGASGGTSTVRSGR